MLNTPQILHHKDKNLLPVKFCGLFYFLYGQNTGHKGGGGPHVINSYGHGNDANKRLKYCYFISI